VSAIDSTQALLRRIPGMRPDLVILDMPMPGISAVQACQRLRAEGDHVPRGSC
jgi:two-component system, OmpR family, phosphate regulon response regulator OmpR